MKQEEKDLNLQLGYFVGDRIVDRYLPTISSDMMHTRTVIQTTIGEADESKRLSDIWFKSSRAGNKGDTKEWIEMREYDMTLQAKYLPKTIECYIQRVTPTYMKAFLKGISASLWGCDMCNYNLEPKDIIVDQEDKYFTKITLTLAKESRPWETKK